MNTDRRPSSDPVDGLIKIGFSEYEAKAYVALLRGSPVTGYQLSKLSGVPRSMIYEVLGKLTARGAAMTLREEGATKYAPIAADEMLDHLSREYQALLVSLRSDLANLASASDLEYVWNIEGDENIVAKAREMIGQAQRRISVALLPRTAAALEPDLLGASRRGVRVVVYTTADLDLAGARVVVTHVSEETLSQARGLGLILVIDGEELLIGEWLSAAQARASWTTSPLLVFVTEHHLRTDLYLPQIMHLLGDRALEVVHEEDRELFVRALESSIGE
jgi:Cd2+/Zn2+-exporting ATPase